MADRSRRNRCILGLGLDSDGHARVTRSEHYVLLGGSGETHERMQEEVERFCFSLRRQGTDLQRASPREMLRAVRDARLPRDS
jgi:hypothetical protein